VDRRKRSRHLTDGGTGRQAATSASISTQARRQKMQRNKKNAPASSIYFFPTFLAPRMEGHTAGATNFATHMPDFTSSKKPTAVGEQNVSLFIFS
jgi:hypothetical protein